MIPLLIENPLTKKTNMPKNEPSKAIQAANEAVVNLMYFTLTVLSLGGYVMITLQNFWKVIADPIIALMMVGVSVIFSVLALYVLKNIQLDKKWRSLVFAIQVIASSAAIIAMCILYIFFPSSLDPKVYWVSILVLIGLLGYSWKM